MVAQVIVFLPPMREAWISFPAPNFNFICLYYLSGRGKEHMYLFPSAGSFPKGPQRLGLYTWTLRGYSNYIQNIATSKKTHGKKKKTNLLDRHSTPQPTSSLHLLNCSSKYCRSYLWFYFSTPPYSFSKTTCKIHSKSNISHHHLTWITAVHFLLVSASTLCPLLISL